MSSFVHKVSAVLGKRFLSVSYSSFLLQNKCFCSRKNRLCARLSLRSVALAQQHHCSQVVVLAMIHCLDAEDILVTNHFDTIIRYNHMQCWAAGMCSEQPQHLQFNVQFASMETIAAFLANQGRRSKAGVEMDARAHDVWAVGSLFVYILTQDRQWFAPAAGDDTDMQTFELRKEWVSVTSAVFQAKAYTSKASA